MHCIWSGFLYIFCMFFSFGLSINTDENFDKNHIGKRKKKNEKMQDFVPYLAFVTCFLQKIKEF